MAGPADHNTKSPAAQPAWKCRGIRLMRSRSACSISPHRIVTKHVTHSGIVETCSRAKIGPTGFPPLIRVYITILVRDAAASFASSRPGPLIWRDVENHFLCPAFGDNYIWFLQRGAFAVAVDLAMPAWLQITCRRQPQLIAILSLTHCHNGHWWRAGTAAAV